MEQSGCAGACARVKRNLRKKWLLWGSNPRPFGHAPEACALDHSAKQPLVLPVRNGQVRIMGSWLRESRLQFWTQTPDPTGDNLKSDK